MKSKETNLECDILSLQKKLEENNLSETDKTDTLNELEVKTLQLENICQYQTRGTIIRSKARWHNEGEKNTKYFLSLEKRHFNTKTIKQLQLDDKSVINTDDKKSFCQKLYSSCKRKVFRIMTIFSSLKVPLGHLRSRREKNAKVY